MKLSDILDKGSKDALASARNNNKRARSIIGPPQTSSKSARPTGQDSWSLVKRLEALGYEGAIQYFYENQEKFGVYVHLSYRECAQLIGQHLAKLSRPASSRWTGKTAGDSQENFHPKYEFRRKSRRGQRPSGSYRVDQRDEGKDIWRSDETVRAFKGLT